ncbi:uncharacterized protein LOC124368552 [Homalodisca vitripennis]|uniref:uncharacterized protein LOC124368552 n=1 Tax=Homalodisca vitripennis TaxID=197043 RepID=UPI001EEA9E8C|nr:uncharacterized protein LOC124368552 [Homalodisca vitripennis]KAG8286461.1 hypothetical protein J6590_059656 [Homalodisca vitripennis]
MLRQLVLLICVGSSVAQSCDTCTCFNVKTVPASMNKLIKYSPLHAQAASTVSQPDSLDSVCLDFRRTHVEGSALVVTTANYLGDSYIQLPFVEKSIDSGVLSGVGPSFIFSEESAGVISALDRVLGEPCNGTFIIYRCILLGSPCITDESQVTVFILSTNKEECQECVDKGIAIAQQNFPHLEFYYLPKTVTDPCRTGGCSR